uniref:DNA (cytosine-5-)-methyltransferase n=1 Tax=Caulerpa verticillata TaxID=177082 RepID=A0A386B0C2_9CHLO|nr:hypothetical protein [Caulerpa verticillata]AYC65144.1 hypothetical protein [Caulerpa verticillata]
MEYHKIKNDYLLSDFINLYFRKMIAMNLNFHQKQTSIKKLLEQFALVVESHPGYTLFPSQIEYRLSIQDCLLLQNFQTCFQLCGCKTSKYKQIGNTIPTNLSFVLGDQI